jgi:uncharacterized membrane protein YheB (UPF0754 family)
MRQRILEHDFIGPVKGIMREILSMLSIEEIIGNRVLSTRAERIFSIINTNSSRGRKC